MKIAHITPFFPPHPGGLQRHVRLLSHGLHERGHEVFVITSDILASSGPPQEGYRVIRLPSKRIRADCFTSGLGRAIRRIGPDIIHTHAPLNIISTKVPFLINGNIPIVSTYHGDFYKASIFGTVVKHVRNYLQLPYVLNNSRAIIALTKFDRGVMIKHGVDPGKIVIVRSGIDISRYQDDTRSDQDNGKIILYAGRVVYEKGIKELILAFNSLQKEMDDVELVIAGTGYALEDMKGLVRELGIGSKVKMLGWVHNDDLIGWYRRSSLLVHPSFSEALPYAVIEAMTCGKAVIASDVSGMNELIVHNENGILYDNKEKGGLLKALHDLIDDPEECERLGKNAAEHCRRELTKERWLDDTVRVYEQVL